MRSVGGVRCPDSVWNFFPRAIIRDRDFARRWQVLRKEMASTSQGDGKEMASTSQGDGKEIASTSQGDGKLKQAVRACLSLLRACLRREKSFSIAYP